MTHKLKGHPIKQSQKIIVTKNVKDEREFISSIEDINPRGIFITIPLHNQTPMDLRRGDSLYLKIPTSSFSMEFSTSVKSFSIDNIPLFILEHPEEYKRIQKRKAVRFKILLDIQIATVPDTTKEKPQFQKATALDLSAGGMEIMTTARYEKDAKLLVKFNLEVDKKNIYEFCLQSLARRVAPLSAKKFKLGVEFLELTKVETDRIFKYIFKKSAEQKEFKSSKV